MSLEGKSITLGQLSAEEMEMLNFEEEEATPKQAKTESSQKHEEQQAKQEKASETESAPEKKDDQTESITGESGAEKAKDLPAPTQEEEDVLASLPEDVQEKIKAKIRKEKDTLRKNIVRNYSGKMQGSGHAPSRPEPDAKEEELAPIFDESLNRWIQPNHPAYGAVWVRQQEQAASRQKSKQEQDEAAKYRIAKGYDTYKDFQDSINYVFYNLDKGAQGFVEASENPDFLIDYLANHPEECSKLNKLDTSRQGYELFKIEQKNTQVHQQKAQSSKKVNVKYSEDYLSDKKDDSKKSEKNTEEQSLEVDDYLNQFMQAYK